MDEIRKIALNRMKNGTHFNYIQEILERAESDNAVKEKVPEEINALKEAFKVEDEMLKFTRKSMLTDEIAVADKERGKLYSSYKKVVKGHLGSVVTEVAKAAAVLNQHIKDYKIDPGTQRYNETGLLTNFIADLETKYAEQVQKLNLTEQVKALKAANEKVIALMSQRDKENMAKPKVGAMQAARKQTDDAYRVLTKTVNAKAYGNKDESLEPFIGSVNFLVTEYKRKALNQTSPSASGSTGGGSTSDNTGGNTGGGSTGGNIGGSTGGNTGGGTGGGNGDGGDDLA